MLDARSNNGLFGGTNLPSQFNKDQILILEGDFNEYFTLYCPREYDRDERMVPAVAAALAGAAATANLITPQGKRLRKGIIPCPLNRIRATALSQLARRHAAGNTNGRPVSGLLLLGYLDSNQEQLMRAGLSVSEAPHPQARMISRKLVDALYPLLRVDTGCFWHFPRDLGTQSVTRESLRYCQQGELGRRAIVRCGDPGHLRPQPVHGAGVCG